MMRSGRSQADFQPEQSSNTWINKGSKLFKQLLFIVAYMMSNYTDYYFDDKLGD